eukprot:gene2915-3202_t
MEESDAQRDLRAKLLAIQADTSLTDAEKAQKRQQLLCGGWAAPKDNITKEGAKKGARMFIWVPWPMSTEPSLLQLPLAEDQTKAEKCDRAKGKQDLLEDTLKCVICCGLCERPVTGPCQHNFCLNCFKRWLGQGKKTCPTCRAPFPAKFCENPRINTLLTYAIRCAKQGITTDAPKASSRIADESRPAEAFTTERAVRNGRANAASGRIMVTVPNDHFGPILPEHDPSNNKGVQVGDWWKDRLDCRQWGAHFPHVAGIAGQSNRGAQSVVLSGGYEDDHDEGEWFLYTGSGGRDLSGNKRTNKNQSFDQEFENMNKALKISCLRGLPVRVVRSAKEKRSSYAPPAETPVRYDGIYRILRCWRKKGAQGFLMCRYLFVRCDNSPAPWTSDEAGDEERLDIPSLAEKEIQQAKGLVFEMGDNPYWGFEAASGQWTWTRDAPPSQKAPGGGDVVKKLKKKASAHERLLKDFSCALCKAVLDQPLSMPCGHNFCKGCLDAKFAAAEAAAATKNGSKALAEAQPARALRVRKVPKPCPTCKADLSEYLSHAAVNTEMAELIRRLQEAAEAARKQAAQEAHQLQDEADTAAAADVQSDEEGDEEGQEADEQQQGDPGDDADMAAAEGLEAGDAGCSSRPPAAKRQCVAPASAAEEAEVVPTPAVTEQAADAGIAAGRYAVEMSQLHEAFPEFDLELIAGLLEDQGGDCEEVHAYLKRQSLASGAVCDLLADDDGGAVAAAVGPGADEGKANQTTGADLQIEQRDIQPNSASDATDAVSKSRKACGSKGGRAAAAGVSGNDVEHSDEAATGKRKRLAAASERSKTKRNK